MECWRKDGLVQPNYSSTPFSNLYLKWSSPFPRLFCLFLKGFDRSHISSNIRCGKNFLYLQHFSLDSFLLLHCLSWVRKIKVRINCLNLLLVWWDQILGIQVLGDWRMQWGRRYWINWMNCGADRTRWHWHGYWYTGTITQVLDKSDKLQCGPDTMILVLVLLHW